MLKLGIDTGGTFTDFFLQTENGIQIYKTPSTPDDPARAIVAGLNHFFKKIPAELEIIHGTTVGTNAFLERKGAKTVLITTAGFEDVLLIGRQNRPKLYDFYVERPAPITSRSLITGVKERMRYDGSVKTPLGKTIGKRLRAFCRQKNAESVAVCLLHSYANDSHEQKIKNALSTLRIPITLSSEILPEFREYERLSTTLINAYLAPIISSYINRLISHLGEVQLFIQQSNGGILPATNIADRSVYTLLSGPAGGVHGANQLAEAMDLEKIITFDMGGTSTDVSLRDKVPSLTRDYMIDGYPIRIQFFDIHTVGAGGGSLVSIDPGGLLKVGPESAGADPGPICYGKGEQLTVTDANLYLGRLLPDRFLGGEMKLETAGVAIHMTALADKLDLDARITALGIIQIVNAGMAKAIRSVSVERGHDPKDFTLFCFGGASGLHCCELALELGIKTIVVPARAGILSAQGMVFSDPALDYMHALFLSGKDIKKVILDKEFSKLTKKGFAEIDKLFKQNETDKSKNLQIEQFLNLRYKGQSYELCVPYEDNFKELFHQAHEFAFGYRIDDAPLELVSIQCTMRMTKQKMDLPKSMAIGKGAPVAETTTKIDFQDSTIKVPVFARTAILPGQQVTGPALVVDDYTTILITQEFHLRVDSLLNLIVEVK